MKNTMDGFIDFIREQGVMGLAIGFILGASVKQVVDAFVNDIIDPIISVFLGAAGNLSEATFTISGITFAYGHFLSVLLDFVIVAAIIYFVFKGLNLDKLDKKAK